MSCLYLTTKGDSSKLNSVQDRLIPEDQKDKILYTVDYKINTEVYCDPISKQCGNVFACSGPQFELDYGLAISNAKKVYETMFPGEEFLPRAPDPEEIIIGGGEPEEEEKNDTNTTETS